MRSGHSLVRLLAFVAHSKLLLPLCLGTALLQSWGPARDSTPIALPELPRLHLSTWISHSQKRVAREIAIPTAYANWADWSVVFHRVLALNAFSGTTTMSPGCRPVFFTPPLNKPPDPPTTEPSARMTKIDFLFAMLVGPP